MTIALRCIQAGCDQIWRLWPATVGDRKWWHEVLPVRWDYQKLSAVKYRNLTRVYQIL